MKTIFTLLLSSLSSLASFAYDGPLLTVSSVGNQKIFVEVDGLRYDMRDNNTVSIRNIYPGTHTVRVLREMKNRSGWNLRIGGPGTEIIYAIKATLRDGYDFDIVVNRFGKILLDERRIDVNDDWYDGEDDRYDNDRNANNSRDGREYNDHGNRNDRDRDWDNNPNGRDNNDDRYDNNNDHDSRNHEMSANDFNQAKETLREEWFENTRISTAKQIIDRNYFTSQQVKELLYLFTFENNRLEIAKYAFSKTVDQSNYFIVNDAFIMNNNKDELNRFIHQQQ